jgi:hypothetical protein
VKKEQKNQELPIGLACCGIHEDDQEISVRFFSCLNRNIDSIHFERKAYIIFLIIKIELGLANCIVLLLKLKEK